MANTTELIAPERPVERAPCPLQVVLCGSFHRAQPELRATFKRFTEAGVSVLSPIDLSFVEERRGFLLAAHERHDDPPTVEERHLVAMRQADFVWLHAPDGYVGASATLELGYAHALGLTVYSAEPPEEEAFRKMVRVAAGPEEAIALSTPQQLGADAPSKALVALQAYYRRAAQRRGWDEESAAETVELLLGEIEELQQALRATGDLTLPAEGEDPVAELADVALYVVHLANVLGIDLGGAIAAKEKINAMRFPIRDRQAA